MANFELMRELQQEADSKIVLLILDGLGGLALEPGGPTELEAAATPNLDRLAAEGSLGQTLPVARGITPGSGPAHLGLFGYDPLQFNIGRGVLEATGIGMQVDSGDIAARGNLVTLDREGRIADRRAGRIPTEEAAPIVERLASIQLEGAEVQARVAREYRLALVMKGSGLAPEIEDTDPLIVGHPPHPARPHGPASEKAARLFNEWLDQAVELLSDQPQANGITLRGFSTNPQLPQFGDIYGLSAACIAVYPMYRGVSSLVGMRVLEFAGETPEDEIEALSENWNEHYFFFVHIKKVDSLGEDGDFEGKARYIERVDGLLPAILELEPSVLAVTGDHSTPARLRRHSWHPVPLLMWAPETIRSDGLGAFGETNCSQGGLGTFQAKELMPLLLAHAQRLSKYGA